MIVILCSSRYILSSWNAFLDHFGPCARKFLTFFPKWKVRAAKSFFMDVWTLYVSSWKSFSLFTLHLQLAGFCQQDGQVQILCAYSDGLIRTKDRCYDIFQQACFSGLKFVNWSQSIKDIAGVCTLREWDPSWSCKRFFHIIGALAPTIFIYDIG